MEDYAAFRKDLIQFGWNWRAPCKVSKKIKYKIILLIYDIQKQNKGMKTNKAKLLTSECRTEILNQQGDGEKMR